MPIKDSEKEPAILKVGPVDSVLDRAFFAATKGEMPIFASMLAECQTSGRGQMRRHWYSPPGNVYAALRLPITGPFKGPEAAIALGALIATALERLHYPIFLKWPNDLAMKDSKNNLAKVGGILLEERKGILIGGIGINVNSAPAILRREAALPATCLKAYAWNYPSISSFWLEVVKLILLLYEGSVNFASNWRGMANSLMVWRGQAVIIKDGDTETAGRFLGVGKDGGALLVPPDCPGAIEEKLSGSMTLYNGKDEYEQENIR